MTKEDKGDEIVENHWDEQVWVTNINANALIILQWNLDLTKGQGTDKFIVISRFFFIYFTITGVK